MIRLLAYYAADDPGSIPAAVAVFHVQAVGFLLKMEVLCVEASSLTDQDIKTHMMMMMIV